MDWDTIEAEFKAGLETNWSNGCNMSLRNKENLPPAPPPGKDKFLGIVGMPREGEAFDGESSNMQYILKEVAVLRELSSRQEEKLQAYEKLIISQGTLTETMNHDLVQRIGLLEKSNEADNPIMNRSSYIEKSHNAIQSKYDEMIYDRILKLEDTTTNLKEKLGDDNTIGELGKLMATSLDHINALSALADQTKKKCNQAISLLESLFRALASLQGEDDIAMTDCLKNIVSLDGWDNQQRIVHILMDSLQRIVDKSIRGQVGAAIECLSDLFAPQLRGVEEDLRNCIQNTERSTRKTFDSINGRFEHNEVRLSGSESKISCLESILQEGTIYSKNLKKSIDSVEQDIKGARATIHEQKEVLDMLTLRHGGSSKVSESELATLRKEFSYMKAILDKNTENQYVLRNNTDDIKFELTQSVEKCHVREGEMQARIDRIRDDSREDATKVKAQVQVLIEQQVGELTRKFNRLEYKFDKGEKKKDNRGVVEEHIQGHSRSVAEMKEVKNATKELADGLDSVRQNIADITFDFDDLKQALKALEKKVEISKSGAVNEMGAAIPVPDNSDQDLEGRVCRVEESIAAFRIAMDSLQEEIVMLSQPPTVDVNGGIAGGRDNIDLRQASSGHCENDTSSIEDDKNAPKKVPIGTKKTAPTVLTRSQQCEKAVDSNADVDFPVDSMNRPSKDDGEMVLKSIEKTSQEISSMGIDLSSSDSSFSSSSDEESDDDIIGIKPKETDGDVTEKEAGSDRNGSIETVETKSPSDVLAEQLRIRAEFERDQALKRVQSKGNTTSPQKGMPGPPASFMAPALAPTFMTASSSSSSLSSSADPIVSGSLLGGGGRRGKSGVYASMADEGASKPIFETIAAQSFEPSKPANTLVAMKHVPESNTRKDTIQCSHCLRRIAKASITVHSKSCELRTELCKNGCGLKILVLKMEQHLLTCPKK